MNRKIIIFIVIIILAGTILSFIVHKDFQNVMKGKKKVLLLCVDPSEPRPGIGAVDMAFIITLDNGDITSIESIYPGQMAHPTATPPPSLKATGVKKWYLHDALWENDTEKGAKLAQEIVEYNTGKKTDVVVIVTPEAVDAILARMGPVYVEGQGHVSGNSIYFLREEQKTGYTRGDAVKSLINAIIDATKDRDKFMILVDEAIQQNAQGNIIVVPQTSVVEFLTYIGFEKLKQ
ncbi:MAG TPA: DUF4012 domain-containing protein [Methanobacteriales archaeon]|nr:DUF4012 domain-containing protein [Methanobacteriaceae archaeon]MBC7096545.1 DUF4012 domain-containing protein [Methanobacteriales archaeon]HIH62105.1 DUF4012 domain-containing protein [Methanobacteriales archaeon]